MAGPFERRGSAFRKIVQLRDFDVAQRAKSDEGVREELFRTRRAAQTRLAPWKESDSAPASRYASETRVTRRSDSETLKALFLADAASLCVAGHLCSREGQAHRGVTQVVLLRGTAGHLPVRSGQAFKDAVPTAPATSTVNGDVTRRSIAGKALSLPRAANLGTNLAPFGIAPLGCRQIVGFVGPPITYLNWLDRLLPSRLVRYLRGEMGDAQYTKPLRCMKKAYTLSLMTEPANVGGVRREA